MIVLNDTMNSIFITYNMAKTVIINKKKEAGEIPEFTREDIPFFYHMYMKKINNIFSTFGNVMFCFEGKNSLGWRREIFPDYKRNRDKMKADSDYLILKETIPVFEELISFYPCKILKVENAEADDIIATISLKYAEEGENVVILSTDGDLVQLNNINKNISVYNPIKMKNMTPKPNVLLEKAIIGDPSDNIPGINGIGAKTLQKMMEDRAFFNEKMKNGNREIVNKFLQIIDLQKIPQELKKNILDEENKKQYNVFSPESIEGFMFEHKMKESIKNWAYVRDAIWLTLTKER